MSGGDSPSKTGLTAKATSGVAWSTISVVSRQIVSFVSMSVLAHLVPPSAYGLLSMSSTATNFIETLRDLGITNALVSASAPSQRLISSVFWINTIVGVALSIAVAISSFPAARWFREPDLVPVMQVMSVSFFIASLGVLPTSLLTRQMSFRAISLAQVGGALLGTSVAIVSAYHNLGVWSLVYATLVNNLVLTTALWVACSWRPRLVLDWQEVRTEIGSHLLNLSGFNLVNYFSRNADNLIVGRYLGKTALGYYQIAYTLMVYPLSNVSAVVAQVVLPAFSRIADDLPRFQAAYIRACRMLSLITFPMMLGLAVTAPEFVAVVLGPRWLPVTGVLLVFAPLGMFQSLFTMIGVICNATRQTNWLFRWGLWSGIAYVVSFFAGLPWGIQGVATSYAIVWFALMIPGTAMVFRFINLNIFEYAREIWLNLKISLLMAMIAFAGRWSLLRCGVVSPPILLGSTVALGVASYLFLLYWLRPPVLSDVYDTLSASNNSGLRRLSRTWKVLLRNP